MVEIVIPIFNEGKNIKELLDTIEKKIKIDISVLFIYDNDDDDTLPVLNAIVDRYPFNISFQKNAYGIGFGNAIRTAIMYASSDYWVMTMADLSDSLETINVMIDKIEEGYDIVVGSRYMVGGEKQGGPFLQSLFSKLGSWGMHLIMGVPVEDISNAFRMYRRISITDMQLSSEGTEILIEILLKAYLEGLRIAQVPAKWYNRTSGESHFKIGRQIPKYLYWCAYAIKSRLFKSR